MKTVEQNKSGPVYSEKAKHSEMTCNNWKIHQLRSTWNAKVFYYAAVSRQPKATSL